MSNQVDCWDLVLADMKARQVEGLSRYGVPLTPTTLPDNLQAMYEEILDAAVYLKAHMTQTTLLDNLLQAGLEQLLKDYQATLLTFTIWEKDPTNPVNQQLQKVQKILDLLPQKKKESSGNVQGNFD